MLRLLALSLISVSSVLAHASEISWEVDNRFRLLVSQDEEVRLAADLTRYMCEVRAPWMQYDKTSGACRTGVAHYRYPSLTDTPYRTHWNERLGKYEQSYTQYPDTWKVKLTARPTSNAELESCLWAVDDQDLPATLCASVAATVRKGSRVHVTGRRDGKDVWSAEETLEPRDILIASIGDSYASGEGNPEVNRAYQVADATGTIVKAPAPASWWDRRCHRSLISGPALAAYRLAKQDIHQSVTFVSFACSGAEIYDGLLTQYEGRETYSQLELTATLYGLTKEWLPSKPSSDFLPTQLDALSEAICIGEYDPTNGKCKGKIRNPDVLLISIGGNDIKFGPVITDFALTERRDSESEKVFREAIRKNREILRNDLATLNGQITAAVRPRAIYITEYPDPTKNQARKYCADGFFSSSPFVPRIATVLGFRISSKEARIAYEEVVLGLQSDLSGMESVGWRYVSGIASASEKKGYCSKTRWFQTYANSDSRQGEIPKVSLVKDMRDGATKSTTLGGFSSGAMHPNIFGHLSYADAIVRSINASKAPNDPRSKSDKLPQ